MRTLKRLTRHLKDKLQQAGQSLTREANQATKSVISSCADEFGAFLERIAEQHRLEWRERMAIHEAGHATLAWRSPSIKRIVITEIREYDGRVMARDTSFPTNISNWYMLSMALAGIAAELQVVGKSQMLTAKYDLQRAHKLATDLVAQGQDATSPPWGTEPDIEGMEDISRAFRIEPPDQEKRVLACGYKHAKTVLAENRSGLLNLAGTLYRQGRLDHAEVIAILGPRPFDERLLF